MYDALPFLRKTELEGSVALHTRIHEVADHTSPFFPLV